MSTSGRATHSRPAPRALFTGLIDDAAVFPPGLAPLPEAVRRHRALRAGPYDALLGPLLVPTSGAAQLRDILAREPAADPLGVVLIARPGTAVPEVLDAVRTLGDTDGVEVAGVELAHQPGWAAALETGLPLVVEVSRNPFAQQRALEELAAAGSRGMRVRAKFRTQSTESAPAPTPAELATFIVRSVRRGLGFKLTGGLHHAVPGTRPGAGDGAEDQHGVLNVLLATRAAQGGADVHTVADILAELDTGTLTAQVSDLTEDDARDLRAGFTAYGCCGVLDPITELRDLRLID